MPLDPAVRDLANGANFAAFTTLFADGAPQTHVMWVGADDEHILINTEVDRQKHRNVSRDARVAVTVIEADNPYHYAEVRGEVVEQVRGQEARDHIDTLSQKYRGKPYPPEQIGTERVILRIRPDRVLHRGN